jgi:prolyl-tRNA synthetase
MRLSRFFISTLKEAPTEAELASHKLMLRAGLISKLGSGLYTWMPLGLRVYQKVETIIREEMNRAGAIELRMPLVHPAELWQETGRWEKFGPQLLKMQDRHEREFCFAPTHEEVISDIARREIKSYKQLPLNFYHITEKFRDEIRPRFGVMRAREFVMKDAYSFDAGKENMLKSYHSMYDAYVRIFTRLGLRFRAVAADTGAIGGSASHEFQVLAEAGEDQIAYCPDSDFAANIELAEALPLGTRAPASLPLATVATPGREKCIDVAAFLQIPIEKTVKSICVMMQFGAETPEEFVMLLLRGDHELNEVKLGKLPTLTAWRMATEAEIATALGARPGSLGPVGKPIKVVVDRTVATMSDFCCGANQDGFHMTGINWGRDLPEPFAVADLRNVVTGDPSPDGKGTLAMARGIEVGHVFALGNVYSKAMGVSYLDENGKNQVCEMGCYGIGVTRVVAAAIEQNHDAKGIVWPVAMAPFTVSLIPLGYDRSEVVKAATDSIYDALVAAQIEVLLDDRKERPGVMFADHELLGIPHRVVISDRGLANGQIEYQGRQDEKATLVDAKAIVDLLLARLATQ